MIRVTRSRLLTATLCLALASVAGAQSVEIRMPGDEPAGPDARERAIQVLIEASVGDNAALRANAIEAMQVAPQRCLPLTQKGLGDPNPGVRFAAVVTAAMLDFDSLVPLIRPLAEDENPSVRAAAIYALHDLGQTVDLTPLADLLVSEDPGTRANVAMLLGLIGDRSAVSMLKQASAAPMPRVGGGRIAVVRCQVAEAICKLGDNSELDTIRAGAFNKNFGEVRVISIKAIGEVRDEKMIPALERFLDDTYGPEAPEVKLAAAESLAKMNKAAGTTLTLQLTYDIQDPIRAQAAWVLGWYNDQATYNRAVQLLDDQNPLVRVTAASSVLRRGASTRLSNR